jgi:hypothetical protein
MKATRTLKFEVVFKLTSPIYKSLLVRRYALTFLNHDFELTNCTLRSDIETYTPAEGPDAYLHAFQSRFCVSCMCSESIKVNERLFYSHCL